MKRAADQDNSKDISGHFDPPALPLRAHRTVGRRHGRGQEGFQVGRGELEGKAPLEEQR